jgi:hypothetical protein
MTREMMRQSSQLVLGNCLAKVRLLGELLSREVITLDEAIQWELAQEG